MLKSKAHIIACVMRRYCSVDDRESYIVMNVNVIDNHAHIYKAQNVREIRSLSIESTYHSYNKASI